jgi:hypothetical protein
MRYWYYACRLYNFSLFNSMALGGAYHKFNYINAEMFVEHGIEPHARAT